MWGHLCLTNNKINHKTQKYTLFIKKKKFKVIVLYWIESIADIIDYSAINTYQKKGLKKINIFVPAWLLLQVETVLDIFDPYF